MAELFEFFFFNRRVSVSASYNIDYEQIKTSTSAPGTGGGGTVVSSFSSLAGLSLNDNTISPLTLPANPALIDGNLTASAGINIGLPPLGGDAGQPHRP